MNDKIQLMCDVPQQDRVCQPSNNGLDGHLLLLSGIYTRFLLLLIYSRTHPAAEKAM